VQVKSSAELGSYLVAVRDIKPNALIFTELPLAIGQEPRDERILSCVGCCREVELGTKAPDAVCPQCKWPACSAECPALSDPSRHLDECPILQRYPDICCEDRGFFHIHFGYEDYRWRVQWPLRVLLLQKRDPERWSRLKELALLAMARQDKR